MHQGEVDGVLAGSPEKVLGAIEGIQPQGPIASDGLAFRTLVDPLLVHQGKGRRRIGGGEARHQVLVHRQIGGQNCALGLVVHREHRRVAEGRRCAAGIGPQNHGGVPAQRRRRARPAGNRVASSEITAGGAPIGSNISYVKMGY